jgi:xanthine/uracil/vitamin C permease (AzgA family)
LPHLAAAAAVAGPALIVVGCLMVSTVRFINWENIQEAFPAFVTIAVMPFTYSISNGLLAGIAATFALWVLDIGSALLQSVLKRSDPDIKPPGM